MMGSTVAWLKAHEDSVLIVELRDSILLVISHRLGLGTPHHNIWSNYKHRLIVTQCIYLRKCFFGLQNTYIQTCKVTLVFHYSRNCYSCSLFKGTQRNISIGVHASREHVENIPYPREQVPNKSPCSTNPNTFIKRRIFFQFSH